MGAKHRRRRGSGVQKGKQLARVEHRETQPVEVGGPFQHVSVAGDHVVRAGLESQVQQPPVFGIGQGRPIVLPRVVKTPMVPMSRATSKARAGSFTLERISSRLITSTTSP